MLLSDLFYFDVWVLITGLIAKNLYELIEQYSVIVIDKNIVFIKYFYNK